MNGWKWRIATLALLGAAFAWASALAADDIAAIPSWASTLIGTGPAGVILAWAMLVFYPQLRRDAREERDAERKMLAEQFTAMRSGNRAFHERLDAMMLEIGKLSNPARDAP